jgi:hypothetical protein
MKQIVPFRRKQMKRSNITTKSPVRNAEIGVPLTGFSGRYAEIQPAFVATL